MEKTKLTKKDLKNPDAFISNMDHFSHWAYSQRKTLVTVFSAVVVLGVVWAAVGMTRAHKEEVAQDSLFIAEKNLHDAAGKFKSPERQTPPGPEDEKQKAEEKKPAAQPSGNLETDYPGVIAPLKEVAEKYAGTQAAVFAALDLGDLYYEYQKYDESIPVLSDALKHADHPVTKALIQNDLGLAYEAKGDCQAALTHWQAIQADKGMRAFQADSLIKSALCYEKLNQPEKAAEIYKRFDNAEKQLRMITENIAKNMGLNTQLPMEMQDQSKVKKFQDAVNQSGEYQELEALVSDRNSIKAAKKYLKQIKRS